MAFKTDVSFLEKISIGAAGTRKVFEDLKRLGHSPIELERGSMSYKIWKVIKIKRVRIPDILCVKCGKRIESRAKTNLVITMSHSVAVQDRGWDFGLDDDDAIAFVRCEKIGEGPVDWKASDLVQYVRVKHLRQTFKDKKIFLEKPKGAEEGFEARITWPSAIASSKGRIERINGNRIQFRRNEDGRIISLSLVKKGIKLKPLVKVSSIVEEDEIIASVIPVTQDFSCHAGMKVDDYLRMLKSASLSDRYGAAKAITSFKDKNIIKALMGRMNDTKEHIYIRLEAAASLLRLEVDESIGFFKAILRDTYLENRLESVIILGEVKNGRACKLLLEVLLDKEQHPEIRAGAAWALGELKSKESLNALIDVFDDINYEIKAESARSLFKLTNSYSRDIIRYFEGASEDARAGISWALSKSGNFTIKDLLSNMKDDNSRKWIAWIIGTQKEEKFISDVEDLKKRDTEVYFAVTVLWKILSSWVSNLEIY